MEKEAGMSRIEPAARSDLRGSERSLGKALSAALTRVLGSSFRAPVMGTNLVDHASNGRWIQRHLDEQCESKPGSALALPDARHPLLQRAGQTYANEVVAQIRICTPDAVDAEGECSMKVPDD